MINALPEAARHERVEEVHRLAADPDVDIDHPGDSNPPLLWAVIKGNREIFDTLLAAGADVNVSNKFGWRALHYAAFITDRVEMARELISRGADIDARTNANFPTALHKAATEGDLELVELLLDAGASLDVPCPTGMSLIEAATKRQRTTIVTRLERAIAKH